MTARVDDLAKVIWDYHHLNHQLKKADAIFVLGSHDIRVAEYAASLFLEGWAPMMIFSGTGVGHKDVADLLGTNWDKPEAEVFADVAMKRGVPKEKIIVENQSTNTGENIEFTKKLLSKRGLIFKSFIVAQKPYMERRTFATFKKIWPDPDIVVTSPPIAFENYPNEIISKNNVVNIMVGDLQRLQMYPQRGFQIPQEIPKEVWRAFEQLVAKGYTKHLIPSRPTEISS